MTVALASGGSDHFGWGQDRHLLADIFDAINQNTRASGNWGKKKAPKMDPYPRPKSKAKHKKKVSVASLFGQFNSPRR
jgi:hypothetical protein